MITDLNTILAPRMFIAAAAIATVLAAAMPAAAFAHPKKQMVHRHVLGGHVLGGHVLGAQNQYQATTPYRPEAYRFVDRNNPNDDAWLCKTVPAFCPDYHGENGL